MRFASNKESYQGVIVEAKDNYFILSSGLEKIYISNYDNTYEIGDIVKIKGIKSELSFKTLESEFDFKDYLNKKGVYSSLIVDKIDTIFKNPIRINSYRKSFLSHFDYDASNLIGSLLFSYMMDSSSPIITNANSLHLMRLMSVSGIYLSFFLKVVTSLLSIKLSKKKSEIISLGILFPYLIFTFPKFNVIKIGVLYLFRWLNNYVFKKKLSYLSLVSLLGIGFLILDYHFVYQDSFILGFSIPLLIYFLRPIVSHKKKVVEKLLLTLGITIFFIPFSLKYYHELAFFSPIYQILLTPIFILLSIIGLIAFIGVPIYPVGNFITKMIGYILIALLKINPSISLPEMNGIILIIFEILYFSFLYYQSINFIFIKRILLVASIMFGMIYMIPVHNYVTEEIDFINVGQGDSCLIRKGDTTVLIDTGGNVYKDIAKEVLIPYFKKKRIYDIDLVITTHDDFDHSGAYESLKENFKIGSYIKDASSFPIDIGNIHLDNCNYSTSLSDNNYSSLVIGTRCAGKDVLITGDAPIAIEKQIMANYSSIPCDILKVGHHGSKTSTCDEWIKYLNPDEAVISCGKDNFYGHPHQEVLDILMNNNVIIKRTDLMGTISYVSYHF